MTYLSMMTPDKIIYLPEQVYIPEKAVRDACLHLPECVRHKASVLPERRPDLSDTQCVTLRLI